MIVSGEKQRTKAIGTRDQIIQARVPEIIDVEDKEEGWFLQTF